VTEIEDRILQNQIEIMWTLHYVLKCTKPELVGRAGELDMMLSDLAEASKDTKAIMKRSAPLSLDQPQGVPNAIDCMEHMPLRIRPLDGDMDEGEHWVIDADNAYVFKICAMHERAERIVAALNAAYSLSRPQGGGQ
jgi:hypothetical protein